MANREKIDLFKLNKAEYISPKKPTLVNIKKARYLSIDGRGAPGGEPFATSIGALYAMAYTVKMTRKFAGEQDYVIGKLETQFWADDVRDISDVPQAKWLWKLLIRTPEFVGKDELKQAARALIEKKKGDGIQGVKLENLAEGQCVQMLHLGPYEREGESYLLMKRFVESQGLAFDGRCHDIYLSDPRRVPPERLKTILRMPVKSG